MSTAQTGRYFDILKASVLHYQSARSACSDSVLISIVSRRSNNDLSLKFRVISLFSAMIFQVIFSQSAYAETLVEALLAAYKNNPSLIADRARQDGDKELVIQAQAGYLPTISLSGATGRERGRYKSPITYHDLDQSSMSVSVSQNLFNGFQTTNQTLKAQALVRAGLGQLLNTEQTVLLAVVTAYMDVLRDRDILQRRKEDIEFLKKELQVTEARKKEGELTQTDIDQAKTRLYQAEAELEQAKANLASSEASYEALIGQRPNQLSQPNNAESYLPAQMKDALSHALDSNPLIVQAKYQKEAADHEVEVARGEFLPTVNLDASYEREFQPSTSIAQSDTGEVAVRLKVPIYEGGATSSKLRQAQANAIKFDHQLRDIKRQVQTVVLSSWQQKHAAKGRINAAILSVRAALNAVNGVRVEAEAGERSVSDILDAQREVINARVSLANAKRDYIVAGFELLAAIGRLNHHYINLEKKDVAKNQERETGNREQIKVKLRSGYAPLKIEKE